MVTLVLCGEKILSVKHVFFRSNDKKHFRVTWRFTGSTRPFWKILTQETRGTKFCRLQFKESMEYLCNICRICSEKSIKETQQQGGSEVTNLPAKECQEVSREWDYQRGPFDNGLWFSLWLLYNFNALFRERDAVLYQQKTWKPPFAKSWRFVWSKCIYCIPNNTTSISTSQHLIHF